MACVEDCLAPACYMLLSLRRCWVLLCQYQQQYLHRPVLFLLSYTTAIDMTNTTTVIIIIQHNILTTVITTTTTSFSYYQHLCHHPAQLIPPALLSLLSPLVQPQFSLPTTTITLHNHPPDSSTITLHTTSTIILQTQHLQPPQPPAAARAMTLRRASYCTSSGRGWGKSLQDGSPRATLSLQAAPG